MSLCLELQHDGSVKISTQFASLPEVKSLLNEKTQKKKEQILTYLFYVHDRDSIYINKFLDERINFTIADRLDGDERWKEFESMPFVKEAIARLNELQWTSSELMVERAKAKLQELRHLWADQPVTSETYENLLKELYGSEKLVKAIKSMEATVFKEMVDNPKHQTRKFFETP